MAMSTRFVALVLAAASTAQAFQPTFISNHHHTVRSSTVELAVEAQERRAFLTAGAAAAASLLLLPTPPALAEEEEELQEVYFGCGCFWHVQHEFVEAEKKILGRSDDELTARAGYAGGKGGLGSDGKVCYHNARNLGDYGKLGHAEVVSIKIPPSKYQDFALEYCKLFKDGLRPDQNGDRGLEYRNLVALKGGSKNPLALQLVEASKALGDQLDFSVGKGSDADSPKLVWIMDTDKFPFYVGEQYHQFHDGFAFGENYPNSYNSLSQKYAGKGEDFGTCPNGMMGVGIGGL
jgi:peptide methionine sulfoxide reductase MsrA